jgi:hypothetical protein
VQALDCHPPPALVAHTLHASEPHPPGHLGHRARRSTRSFAAGRGGTAQLDGGCGVQAALLGAVDGVARPRTRARCGGRTLVAAVMIVAAACAADARAERLAS